MASGLKIQRILRSYILFTTVKTLTMEKQTLLAQDVVIITMNGVQAQNTTLIRSMPKKCVVYAGEVT
jgi:hypothetical protein